MFELRFGKRYCWLGGNGAVEEEEEEDVVTAKRREAKRDGTSRVMSTGVRYGLRLAWLIMGKHARPRQRCRWYQ